MRMLIKDTDTIWSRYVRLRDSTKDQDGNWYGTCITSGRTLLVLDNEGHWHKNAQCGHYIGRGNLNTRFLDENTNLQSAYDNAWRDKREMLEAYENAIDDKYGDDVVRILIDLKKNHDKTHYGRAEIISAYEYAKQGLSDILES